MHALKMGLIRFFSSLTWAEVPQAERKVFLAILSFHFALSVAFVTPLDFTSDEIPYQNYAGRWMKGHPERIINVDDSKSPIVLPALLPIVLKPVWHQADDPYGFRFLRVGRYFMYVYVALAAWVMLCWARRLWGAYSWVIPLCFFLLDPTLFSNAMLVGSDVASMALLFAALYLAWRYIHTSDWRYWWWLCIATGLALVAKASLIYWLPILAILLFISRQQASSPQKQLMTTTFWKRWLVMAGVLWLIINISYYFHHSFFSIQQFPKQSLAFQQLTKWFSNLGNLRVPLPYDFVSAFDGLQLHAEQGGGPIPQHTFTGVSILGRYYPSGPVWYYYLVSGGFKIPLFFMVLMVAALVKWWSSKQIKVLAVRYLFIWFPALVFLLILSFANPFQIGFRHALLVMPLLYLGMAPVANRLWQLHRQWFWIATTATMVLWCSFWPNMIAYTNELLWPKKNTYKYLYHSTISMGHANKYLVDFLKIHPDFVKADSIPRPGKFAASLESIMHPFDQDKLQWLRYHFEPVGTYRHTILLYDINAEQLQNAGFKYSGK